MDGGQKEVRLVEIMDRYLGITSGNFKKNVLKGGLIVAATIILIAEYFILENLMAKLQTKARTNPSEIELKVLEQQANLQ